MSVTSSMIAVTICGTLTKCQARLMWFSRDPSEESPFCRGNSLCSCTWSEFWVPLYIFSFLSAHNLSTGWILGLTLPHQSKLHPLASFVPLGLPMPSDLPVQMLCWTSYRKCLDSWLDDLASLCGFDWTTSKVSQRSPSPQQKAKTFWVGWS